MATGPDPAAPGARGASPARGGARRGRHPARRPPVVPAGLAQAGGQTGVSRRAPDQADRTAPVSVPPLPLRRLRGPASPARPPKSASPIPREPRRSG